MTMPTSVPDAIILACWHRYQLVSALLTGAPLLSALKFIDLVPGLMWQSACHQPCQSSCLEPVRIIGAACLMLWLMQYPLALRSCASPTASACAGEGPTFPKHASVGARRDLKDASPVSLLARHFSAGHDAPFDELAAQHEAALREEGLGASCASYATRFPSRRVRKLTNTYLTISLEELRTMRSVEDADAAKKPDRAVRTPRVGPCAFGGGPFETACMRHGSHDRKRKAFVIV